MFTADELLDPISPDAPAGEDLSFAPDLDAIAHARRFDDPSLDQGEWVTERKEADWDFVVRRCAALLRERSKDLRLAVWLTEAGAKTLGMRGMVEGVRVVAGLCQDYWDVGLYPEADEDDHEQRIGNLSWVLARIPPLLREIPLTEPRHGSHSALDFDSARRAASAGGSEQAANRLATLETARRNTAPQFHEALRADLDACLAALRELEQVADDRLGQDSPGFSAARDAVENLKRMIPAAPSAAAAAPAVADSGQPVAGAGSAAVGTLAAAPQLSMAPGVLQNRAQALAQLRAVAAFFRHTEPHSPVSYYADKAANAGEQNLHDWLRSVVKDGATMAHIEELLGVKRE